MRDRASYQHEYYLKNKAKRQVYKAKKYREDREYGDNIRISSAILSIFKHLEESLDPVTGNLLRLRGNELVHVYKAEAASTLAGLSRDILFRWARDRRMPSPSFRSGGHALYTIDQIEYLSYAKKVPVDRRFAFLNSVWDEPYTLKRAKEAMETYVDQDRS